MSNLKKVLTGSFLLSSEAVLRKLVGLISTLFLARLLVPDDFGLIAIAIMVMGFIDAMKQFGGMAYLLKSENIDTDMINTSWTISFCTNLVMACLLVLATPLVADYYSDERLKGILWAFCGIWVIRSIGNPALVMLRREQNYLPLVKLSIITKVFAVIVVIISALIYKSYWALVLGQLTTYSSMTIGGYFIYKYRPKFCLSGFKEQWKFSSWWMLQSFVGFVKAQLDTFLVSSMFNKSALGSYHTIKYFASMPITFLLEPASTPLLVELRKIKNNKNHFSRQFNISLTTSLLAAVPICLFLVQEHYLVTATLLGQNWVEYSELFAIFCISIVTYVVQRQAADVLLIFSTAKAIFYFQLISFATIYGILISVGITNIIDFAMAKVWMEALAAFCLFTFVVFKYTSFNNIISFVIAMIPIIISVMMGHYLAIKPDVTYPVFFQLVIAALNFFVIYGLCLVTFAFIFKRINPEWRYIWNLAEKSVQIITKKLPLKSP